MLAEPPTAVADFSPLDDYGAPAMGATEIAFWTPLEANELPKWGCVGTGHKWVSL